MMRLVMQGQAQLPQIDEIDVEPLGIRMRRARPTRAGRRDHPVADGPANPAVAHAGDENEEFHGVTSTRSDSF